MTEREKQAATAKGGRALRMGAAALLIGAFRRRAAHNDENGAHHSDRWTEVRLRGLPSGTAWGSWQRALPADAAGRRVPAADGRVTLQTPVTLSLYRCPEAQRKQEIEVSVPESETDLIVRVTLQAEGSSVEWTYVTYTCAAELGRTQVVTLDLPDGRDYICMIYIDGVLSQRLVLSEMGSV